MIGLQKILVPGRFRAMSQAPAERTIELTPESRLAIIDVSKRIEDLLSSFPRALFCSYHTTAGYLEQQLCEKLRYDPESVQAYVQSFQKLFPPDADYRHDRLDLRIELSEEERKVEPRNADSHLTFIGSGLENCVTYRSKPDTPVYFIDLDGTNGKAQRQRRTTVIGFNREVVAARVPIRVPVSGHPIDSINFRDPKLGLYEQLQEQLSQYGIAKGRIDLALDPLERHTGLTVNEYETLLMANDLAQVLRNPLRFMAEKGKNMLLDPKAIPSKARNYAKYDLVQVVNEFLDVLGWSESLVERIIDRFLRYPASRFLRMKRGVSLLVSDENTGGEGAIMQGKYQSPILVQWHKAEADTRLIHATFVRFE